MITKQINLKISERLFESAKEYADMYGFKNIQELISESLRERVFNRDLYDDSFDKKEVCLIEKIISKSIEKNKLKNESELNGLLLE